MKKIIIPIMLFLPLMIQAQTESTEEQQLEQAKQQLEQAKKALKAAQIRAQAAKLKAQADSLEQASKLTKEPTPSLPKEEKVSNTGWSIPVAVAKKTETQKKVQTVNGVTLKEDPKYLEGAITLNNEGKVVFTLDTDANGKTADQIYEIVYQYMSELPQDKNNIASRTALVNKGEHIIANTMDEWLVFNASFISLDRTEVKYNLVAKITDNHLNLTLARIIYNYEQDRSTGFCLPAEEVIVDKVALTKKKNDLAKIFGKFRRLTIDRKDQIFNDLTTLVKQ